MHGLMMDAPLTITEIMKFGVMTTPALVVDGTVKVSGRLPSKEEVKNFLK